MRRVIETDKVPEREAVATDVDCDSVCEPLLVGPVRVAESDAEGELVPCVPDNDGEAVKVPLSDAVTDGVLGNVRDADKELVYVVVAVGTVWDSVSGEIDADSEGDILLCEGDEDTVAESENVVDRVGVGTSESVLVAVELPELVSVGVSAVIDREIVRDTDAVGTVAVFDADALWESLLLSVADGVFGTVPEALLVDVNEGFERVSVREGVILLSLVDAEAV